MKIRDKLLLGFGLNIFLVLVLGLLAYKELRTIETRLTLVEVADDITNTLLEVRRYEKNFLLYRDSISLEEFRKYLQLLRNAIDHIKTEIVVEIGDGNYDMLKKTISQYERQIQFIIDNRASQKDMEALVRTRGREVERQVTGSAYQSLLVLRRYEKNVMLYKDVKSFQVFSSSVEHLGLDQEEPVKLYALIVTKLHYLYQEEKSTVESMRQTARVIQQFTENLSKKERADIAATIRTSVILLFAALGSILVVGTIINSRLATSIVTPIVDLERITKKITRGDFSENIEVRGHDEITSLEESFNQMEDKLDHAMTALEETITKLQEKQSQLVEAEKLASIGKLAAGIAHEINNPLTSVLTFSNLMLEQCPPEDPRHSKLKIMVRETDRARTIVRQLLNFGRESVIKPVKININRPVTEITESLMAQEAFKGIDLSMILADDLPEVYADPAQFGQVVLNLLLNAIHAITPPGRIEVATRLKDKTVEVIFTDTGAGIPEKNLHKIFDPFFTTKDASKGTGLGLAVSYGIIQKHGGEIKVESEVNRGTTFTVRMPVYG